MADDVEVPLPSPEEFPGLGEKRRYAGGWDARGIAPNVAVLSSSNAEYALRDRLLQLQADVVPVAEAIAPVECREHRIRLVPAIAFLDDGDVGAASGAVTPVQTEHGVRFAMWLTPRYDPPDELLYHEAVHLHLAEGRIDEDILALFDRDDFHELDRTEGIDLYPQRDQPEERLAFWTGRYARGRPYGDDVRGEVPTGVLHTLARLLPFSRGRSVASDPAGRGPVPLPRHPSLQDPRYQRFLAEFRSGEIGRREANSSRREAVLERVGFTGNDDPQLTLVPRYSTGSTQSPRYIRVTPVGAALNEPTAGGRSDAPPFSSASVVVPAWEPRRHAPEPIGTLAAAGQGTSHTVHAESGTISLEEVAMVASEIANPLSNSQPVSVPGWDGARPLPLGDGSVRRALRDVLDEWWGRNSSRVVAMDPVVDSPDALLTDPMARGRSPLSPLRDALLATVGRATGASTIALGAETWRMPPEVRFEVTAIPKSRSEGEAEADPVARMELQGRPGAGVDLNGTPAVGWAFSDHDTATAAVAELARLGEVERIMVQIGSDATWSERATEWEVDVRAPGAGAVESFAALRRWLGADPAAWPGGVTWLHGPSPEGAREFSVAFHVASREAAERLRARLSGTVEGEIGEAYRTDPVSSGSSSYRRAIGHPVSGAIAKVGAGATIGVSAAYVFQRFADGSASGSASTIDALDRGMSSARLPSSIVDLQDRLPTPELAELGLRLARELGGVAEHMQRLDFRLPGEAAATIERLAVQGAEAATLGAVRFGWPDDDFVHGRHETLADAASIAKVLAASPVDSATSARELLAAYIDALTVAHGAVADTVGDMTDAGSTITRIGELQAFGVDAGLPVAAVRIGTLVDAAIPGADATIQRGGDLLGQMADQLSAAVPGVPSSFSMNGLGDRAAAALTEVLVRGAESLGPLGDVVDAAARVGQGVLYSTRVTGPAGELASDAVNVEVPSVLANIPVGEQDALVVDTLRRLMATGVPPDQIPDYAVPAFLPDMQQRFGSEPEAIEHIAGLMHKAMTSDLAADRDAVIVENLRDVLGSGLAAGDLPETAVRDYLPELATRHGSEEEGLRHLAGLLDKAVSEPQGVQQATAFDAAGVLLDTAQGAGPTLDGTRGAGQVLDSTLGSVSAPEAVERGAGLLHGLRDMIPRDLLDAGLAAKQLPALATDIFQRSVEALYPSGVAIERMAEAMDIVARVGQGVVYSARETGPAGDRGPIDPFGDVLRPAFDARRHRQAETGRETRERREEAPNAVPPVTQPSYRGDIVRWGTGALLTGLAAGKGLFASLNPALQGSLGERAAASVANAVASGLESIAPVRDLALRAAEAIERLGRGALYKATETGPAAGFAEASHSAADPATSPEAAASMPRAERSDVSGRHPAPIVGLDERRSPGHGLSSAEDRRIRHQAASLIQAAARIEREEAGRWIERSLARTGVPATTIAAMTEPLGLVRADALATVRRGQDPAALEGRRYGIELALAGAPAKIGAAMAGATRGGPDNGMDGRGGAAPGDRDHLLRALAEYAAAVPRAERQQARRDLQAVARGAGVDDSAIQGLSPTRCGFLATADPRLSEAVAEGVRAGTPEALRLVARHRGEQGPFWVVADRTAADELALALRSLTHPSRSPNAGQQLLGGIIDAAAADDARARLQAGAVLPPPQARAALVAAAAALAAPSEAVLAAVSTLALPAAGPPARTLAAGASNGSAMQRPAVGMEM